MIWNDLFLGNLALNWGAELHRLLVRLMHTHAKHWARLGTENARANKKKNLTFLPRRQQGRRLKKKGVLLACFALHALDVWGVVLIVLEGF